MKQAPLVKKDGRFRTHTLRTPHQRTTMVESLVSAAIAVITGGFVLTARIQSQIKELDKRVDGVELCVATSYVSKQDLQVILERMENHLNRIEEKMDRLVERN